MDYKGFNDYELISYVRENNEEANEIMFQKYRPLIENASRRILKYCKYSGLEFNDLVQEGMIGLSSAINNFEESKEASFYTYAKTCIERRLISAVIGSQRQKHRLLNESMSFEIYNDDNEQVEYDKVLIDNSYNPESIALDYEKEVELVDSIKSLLTDFEQQVFELKISGFNYREIAEVLDKEPKAIDNALNRIKNKIKDKIKR